MSADRPEENRESLRRLFGERLREIRSRLGLTQKQLGQLAGMHPAYVGGVERGERNITLDGVERLARALSVSPAELMVTPSGPSLFAGTPQRRFQELAARARSREDLLLALDVACYLLEQLEGRARASPRAAAEPPAEYNG